MIPKVENTPSAEVSPEGRAPQPAPPSQAAQDASVASLTSRAQALASADLRLVIEEDGQPGLYIYKTIDRRTGEVVNQFPREEILRIRHSVDYSAGRVVKSEA